MPEKLNGYNQVFCKGRFIAGPDARSSALSVLMILVPSILWQIFVGAFFADQYGVLLPLFAFLLQVGSLGLLLATAFSDPGIMPRQKDFTEHYDERAKVFRTREPQRFYDVILRGHPFKLKYCKTCNIYRPPRCTHCSVCENCVERFDHHCPWLGNCIGKRNYRLFYGFVSATGALNILVLATAVAQLALRSKQIAEESQVGGGDAFGQAVLTAPMAAILSIYALGIVWFTFGLCAYHNYLVCTNQTTYEQIKGAFSGATNPFHRGAVGNYWDILFTSVRPRYFNAHTNRLLWPPKGAVPLEEKLRSTTKMQQPPAPRQPDTEIEDDLRLPEEVTPESQVPPLPREEFRPEERSGAPTVAHERRAMQQSQVAQPQAQEPLSPPTASGRKGVAAETHGTVL
eukprot:CAMPEP_0181532206 /NCGR_PEP_ID=MMETSP1110-20121109/72494_1 /TAXON_ID=174948 /ORGANISM="Symbiodinium sp., Strain CCMP421" /LENGTH=399 /DNA_ID=CAMNT_0023663295 /DNA_START=36 /DNA_END=1235 /DNA_ORIENTATION=-